MTELPSPVPMPGGSAPPISRAIYGMPMFATLLVADVGRTTAFSEQMRRWNAEQGLETGPP